MRALPVAALTLLIACSSSTSTNTGGGTGGSGGGTSAGGGTGGGTAGGTGGGSGGGTGGGTGGGSGGIALADYCTKYEEFQCAQAKRCGTAAPNADCKKVLLSQRFQLVNARTDCLFVDLRTALSNGTATFHGDKAATCFAATTACNVYTQLLDTPACSEIFTGTKSIGAACRNTGECVPAAYCDSSTSVCPGTCKARVAAGGTASSAAACALGTVYTGQSDGGATCQATVALGGDCTPPPGAFFGKTCQGDAFCANPGDGGTRLCTAPLALGAPCAVFTNDNCGPGTTCGPNPDGGSGLLCRGLRKTGESCDSSGLGIPCQTGLACTNNVCGPLVANGGACSQDQDCVANSGCTTPGATCRAYGAAGAPCTTANLQDDCGVGLFCGKDAGTCEARRGRDAPCPNGNECSIELGFGCKTVTDGGPARCSPVACLNP